jgi:FlaA1/EpsC-like NDP-sugar epimerase
MAVVKIQNKDRLDQLVARLTMRLGRKPTQQEVVDICIRMGDKRFEELISRLNPVPILDDTKMEKILAIPDELADVPWNTPKKNKDLRSDDADIYGT